jgi:hypothetical protein
MYSSWPAILMPVVNKRIVLYNLRSSSFLYSPLIIALIRLR